MSLRPSFAYCVIPHSIENLESMLPGKLSLDRFAYNGRAAPAKTDSLGLNASAATEYANAEATHDNGEFRITRHRGTPIN